MKWVDDEEMLAWHLEWLKVGMSAMTATYTFHIRKGALWSDGEAVTAYDFEYA